jgi:hypothetical protein
MKTVAIPVSVFRVDCEIASGRPFSMVERTILRSIAFGNHDYEDLINDICLHPRVTAEALTALFEAGIINFQQETGGFLITDQGTAAVEDASFIPTTLRMVRKSYRVVVERITGLADIGTNVTFERTDELRDRGVAIIAPSDINPVPARSNVRQLVQRQLQAGEWVRSVGPPRPEFQYNQSVQVDLRGGRIERLRSSEWTRALGLALRERGFDLIEPEPTEPRNPWIGVDHSRLRVISGVASHSKFLEELLSRATSYVYIHSGFLTGARAQELVEPIRLALRRGVDVLLLRGGTEEGSASDNEGVLVFRKLSYDERGAPGRFFFGPYPTGSHAKILICDGEEICIGS